MIGGTVVLNKPSTLALTHNGANSEIRLSGFRTAIGNSGTNSLTDGIVIGNSRNRLSNRGMTGDMNEFCLYTRILEPGEIATIERYFESKWGTS